MAICHANYQIYQAHSFWTMHIIRKVVLLPLSSMTYSKIRRFDTLISKIVIAQKLIDGSGWYFQILIATHGLWFLRSLNEIEIISSVIWTTCLSKPLLMISTYNSLPLSLCIWITKHILIALYRYICHV